MKFRTNLNTRHNTSTVLLHTVIFLGIIIGSIFNAVYDLQSDSIILRQNIAPIDVKISLLDSFKSSLFIYTAFLISFALNGLFAIGQAFSILLLIFRGFAIGFSLSSIYISLGLKAVIPVAVTILPKLIAVSVIFVLSARESLRLSSKIFSFLFLSVNDEDIINYIKLYFIKFAILTVFIIVTAVAESAINYFFIDLFY